MPGDTVRPALTTNGQETPEWEHGRPDPMTLAQLLPVLAGLFSLSLLFFSTSGGYYDTDAYDGNGTAH